MIPALCCVHILFIAVTGLTELRKYTGNRDARDMFALTLSNLVRVHEKRMEAVKQLAKLQDYRPFPKSNFVEKPYIAILRTNERVKPSGEQLNNVNVKNKSALIMFIKENAAVEPYRNLPRAAPQDTSRPDKLSSRMPECSDRVLRAIPITRSYYGRRGHKKCVKACKEALRSACSYHSCGRSMRRKFKKECKVSCKDYFRYT